MSDFFKQVLLQFNALWTKLHLVQRAIIALTLFVTVIGMISLIAWSSLGKKENGMSTLFVNLSSEDAARVTEVLKDMNVIYSFENEGKTLTIPKENLYEARMQLARVGLPQSGGQGYQLFDKLQLGMTDFVQNLNYKRALEGELSRTIMTLKPVEKVRVHITIPKPSLFTEKKEEATASVIVQAKPGEHLDEKQVRGITHLVASSVEGLKARQVTVVDVEGNMLTKGFADNAMAEQTDHNVELQHTVEKKLEDKVEDIFSGLLGPNKTRVKISVDLDFAQVQKTIEHYDPVSKVVRSQQRDEVKTSNSPSVGDEQREGTITNYEIDKTVANIISVPGARKRITVSVAVDGKLEQKGKGKTEWISRTPEEIDKFTELVKNAVGYRPGLGDSLPGDQVFVTCVQFDKGFYQEEKEEMASMARKELFQYWGKVAVVACLILFGFLFLKSLAQNIALAMNPPVPKYAGLELKPPEEEIPEEVRYQQDLLERAIILTQEDPQQVASLIKNWLSEGKNSDTGTEKKKKKK